MIRIATAGRAINAGLMIKLSILIIFLLAGCGGSGNIPAASVLSSGRITLSWNDVPGAASYEIYMSTSPGVTVLNSYKISDITAPITITDLEPGTTYYFMIAVFNDSGESRISKEVSFTVAETEGFLDFGDLIDPSRPENQFRPSAPSKLPSFAENPSAVKKSTKAATQKPARATTQKSAPPASRKPAAAAAPKAAPLPAKKTTQTAVRNPVDTRDVTLAWDDVPGATSYNIYWRDQPGVTRQNGTKIGNATNPYKLRGLTKGKKYYFVVTAVNRSGESSESAEFSFTAGE